MAHSMNMNLIIITLVMISISQFPSSSDAIVDPDPSTKSLINKICKKTVDFKKCDLIVTSQLNFSHADIVTITKLTTKRALTNANGTLALIQDSLLPNATDSRDKAVFSACEIAYKAVVSRLHSAYKSMYVRDYVAMKAQHNQALRYIEVCVKRTNFFRRTPIVGANYMARLMTNISSIAGQILAPSTTS
ncbi:hypothetical protein V5N11_002274 [Cardamine amara subsp. amara]|uniref:Pectinesterase inhibitor domain-containing protein n=1 Tax=Cardamine amara subsp. amara TaxID=228776 RepID=A0ABD1BLT6_CARAN